ncbi:hypothetical protein Glove_82g90 [Diversispora epigaea]|uniref:Protein kinase domain-containing protein n=1 Tax=Diversispora epigaea TaxID=1348612 RepID=A0A397JA48_9GLOM|nr:hypothetical protein Glove_82g90 [Diversispora epigaea]
MATQEIVWNKKLSEVWNKVYFTMDSNIHKTVIEKEEYLKTKIQNDSSLTENEKSFLLNELWKKYDIFRIANNAMEKKLCDNCQSWRQAIKYCEICIRKYLKNNFGNWTSENDEIDKLIQECQQKTVAPFHVIEWINFDQFENIEYLTAGGCASIYTAMWKDGCYHKWNSENQILERLGKHKVILKRLNNSNNDNVKWFQEVTLSFTLDNTFLYLSKYFGLTKDPITNDYIIIYVIAISLHQINSQNVVHRDLHSGNILCSHTLQWYISDLGLSGPVNKPLNSIYGNLPYVAPEVLCDQIYTTKSDTYSLGILMWEIITGEVPYGEHEHDLYLMYAIVKGYRPKIHEEIPHEYADLMKQCWDADPNNRPCAFTICEKMGLLINSLYNEMNKQRKLITQPKKFKSKIKNFFKLKLTRNKDVIKNTRSIKNTKSKVYNFNMSISIQPRNATVEEQKIFHSKLNDELIISDEMEQLYFDNLNK